MKQFAAKVGSAAAPVLGVLVAISILRAAGVPFPVPLELDAWAQWVVFASVVYACTALCSGGVARLSGAVPRAQADGADKQD